MKYYLFILIIIFSSCESYDFDDDKVNLSQKGNPTRIYSSSAQHFIIKEGGEVSGVYNHDANYYFQNTENSEKQFVLNCLHLDCNEKLDSVKWNSNSNYFTFFITESSRFKAGSRLTFYKITDGRANKLLDIRDSKIVNDFFTEYYYRIVYNGTNDTVSIKL